jgi:hypothetical protein
VTSAPAVVALLTAAVGFSGAGCAGYGTNHLDIAPHIAGILLGISNTLATVPGIVLVNQLGFVSAENNPS